MTTLQDQMQERMDSRPDKHTLAWWDQQFREVAKGYRGLTHACNRVLADNEDLSVAQKGIAEQLASQSKELQEANAKIGKLQAEVLGLKEAMEKARAAYAEVKRQISKPEN